MLSVFLEGVPEWVEQGPGTIENGNNVEGIANRPQAGAVNALAPDPTNADRLFAATTNGGIWRTNNATAAFPTWEPLTDQFGSLSIGDIAISPLDPTMNTLYAGAGRFSSGFGDGGAHIGLLKTTDGGDTWSLIEQNVLAGRRIVKIIPTTLGTPDTQVVLIATGNGIFRSTDGGVTIDATPVLAGNIRDMDADPGDPNRFYAAFEGAGNGFFISPDGGENWDPINNNIPAAVINTSDFAEMAVHNSPGNNAVYAVTFDNQGSGTFVLNAFRSTNQGTSWTAMDQPPMIGIPRRTAIIADPADPNVVYISSVVGQNLANCARPSARTSRGDAAQVAGSQWLQVICDNANGTSPHPDARDLVFDANGDLLEANDGGVYRLLDPNNAGRVWESVNGDLRTVEFYAVAYDSLNNSLFGGTQDNGTPQQTNPAALPGDPPPTFTWFDRTGGDGGVVQVDNTSTNCVIGVPCSIHYQSNQNLGGFSRDEYDNANTEVLTTRNNVQVIGAGPAGMENNLFGIETALAGGTTVQFMQPWALNKVDPDRMIIGTNFLYESMDQGATITSLGGPLTNLNADGSDNDQDTGSGAAIPPLHGTDEGDEFAPTGPVGPVNPSGVTNNPLANPIAYGGTAGGAPNPNVLWLGAGGNLFLRTMGGGLPSMVPQYGAAGGAAVIDIVLDPDDWHIAYIVDVNGGVFRAETDDPGTNTTFADLTENLGDFATDLRTIEFLRSGLDEVVLVGGQRGVYRAINPDMTTPVWSEVGLNLPNAVAQELSYDASADLLAVATFGRGMWALADASQVLTTPGVLTVCGDDDHVNQDDEILLIRDSANPLLLDVFVNGVLEFSGPLAGFEQINAFGIGGNDSVTVDSSFGLIGIPGGIRYDGDGACPGVQPGFGYDRGFDALHLIQDEGPTHVQTTYSVGPDVGSGTIILDGDGGDTQTIFFEELEPVVDLIPANQLIVNATPEANAINYTVGSLLTTGSVTVDNFESIEFSNKTWLTINAQAGDDVVNVSSAFTPMSLASITVNAGFGDDVVTTDGGLTVAIEMNGGVGNDYLSAAGTIATATLEGGLNDDFLEGGSAADMIDGGPGNDVLIGGGDDDLLDGGPNLDTVLIQGTLANDVVDVFQPAPAPQLRLEYTVNADSQTDEIESIEEVRVEAGAGNDLIRVGHDDAYTDNDGGNGTPDQTVRITVVGDAPDASDRLVVRDDGLGDLVLHREGPGQRTGRITVSPGNTLGTPADVVYQGVEFVNISPHDPVTGTTGDDGRGRLVVFDTDPFEANNSRLNPTDLDALGTVPVNPNVDPGGRTNPFGDGDDVPGDEDWYRFMSPKIGTFAFQVFFEEIGTLLNGRSGLPGDGGLEIEVYDGDGSLVVSGNPIPGGQQAVFGIEGGDAYYLRVHGASAEAINIYDVKLVEVDRFGAEVTEVLVTAAPGYDLFDPKPSTDGPTPPVFSLTIGIQDPPERAPGFLYPALDEAVAIQDDHYVVRGDHNGIIPILDIIATNDPVVEGQIATATIELVFAEPLPDDRYTLLISDTVLDPAGNKLDGESNASEPQETPSFPSGDLVAGGEFTARFTVDTRPEIGTFSQGSIYIDINGNFVFDTEGKDRDSTNRDIAFVFGFRDDRIFAGNFAPAVAASASGFDKLGAYGTQGQGPQAWHWRLDFDHDGVVDLDVVSDVQTQGDPVAGEFSAAHPGDEIGLFSAGKWWLDSEGDNNIGGAGDTFLQGDMRGQPLVGDFDGDGLDDLATWNAGNAGTQFDGEFQFDLASNGLTGDAETTIQFDLPGVFQIAVAADMNADGIDDVGLFVTRRQGVPPEEAAEWFFLVSDDPTPTSGEVTALTHPFTPVPFGTDLFAQFGDDEAAPVLGNFDPPVRSSLLMGDANRDGVFNQLDIVQVLESAKYGTDEPAAWGEGDWNDDGVFDQLDIIAARQTGRYMHDQSGLHPRPVDLLFGSIGR